MTKSEPTERAYNAVTCGELGDYYYYEYAYNNSPEDTMHVYVTLGTK